MNSERDESCGTYWGEERCVQDLVKERDQLENLGVYGSMILKVIFKRWVRRTSNWIWLAQDRDRGWAVVNAVMNFRVL